MFAVNVTLDIEPDRIVLLSEEAFRKTTNPATQIHPQRLHLVTGVAGVRTLAENTIQP